MKKKNKKKQEKTDKKKYTKIHDDSEEFAKALKKIKSLIKNIQFITLKDVK